MPLNSPWTSKRLPAPLKAPIPFSHSSSEHPPFLAAAFPIIAFIVAIFVIKKAKDL